MEDGQGLLGLWAGLGFLLQEWEGLCGIVLLRLLMGSLNWTVFMVFLHRILESDTFGGLPHAIWLGRAGEGDHIYVQLSHEVRYLEFENP